MNNLFAARSQMALSLAFHIIFSCIAMVMPFFMCISHFFWLRTGKPIYKSITRAWSKGVAIFFATGAVSGTVLSFELGLLWPAFMKHAGPIFGMPFSLEGTAFFIEAIAFGFYLYGWDRFNRGFHWLTGLVVGLSGIVSGILVVAANSWMNCPAGFDFKNGEYTNIDPLKAMFNRAWFSQSLHMTIAAFAATGFAVAGIHALMVLKKKNVEFHAVAFRIAALFASIAAIVQPLSGDISAKFVARNQPAKLAAMEAHFKTRPNSPLIIGGIPDVQHQKVNNAIQIPGMLSFMVYENWHTPVKGLDQIPKEDQPPVPVVHYAFQVMVGLGMLMMGISLLYFYGVYKKREPFSKVWFLRIFAAATPIGFLAVEAGWTVTEVGRQPWVIQGIMRTSEAVTPMPGIYYSFGLFVLVYISLALAVLFLLIRHIRMLPTALLSN
ncbi:MAG TPA: cytochrome ubiquinol oxidase subunit I [Mucilaginibacter sp.]|jgi:cytochrome d ubiquinol oxidase subunit I